MAKKRVIVLGSTGSIGRNALDVIRHLGDSLQVVALSCGRNIDAICQQAVEFEPRAVAVVKEQLNKEAIKDRLEACSVSFYEGEQGLLRMIQEVEADIVLNGISGSRGLLPSLKALEAGKDLANANKESIVMAGPLLKRAARSGGKTLIPVDSEHYAIFSMFKQLSLEQVDEIVLTASGGAFRDLSFEQLKEVRIEDALTHPNWVMGTKNTVDSATMANKGLEVIEAHHLFGLATAKIQVLIHPQSFVHSLVRTIDGFLYAQLSQPDMRLVIQNALTYPELYRGVFGTLDLTRKDLTFQPVDPKKFRMLHLAYQAAERGRAYPIVFNAANEMALGYFLSGTITFIEMPAVVEEALQMDWDYPVNTVEEILAVDGTIRRRGEMILKNISRTI